MKKQTLLLCTLAVLLFSGCCSAENKKGLKTAEAADIHYVPFVLTNIPSYGHVESYLKELTVMFGPNDPRRKKMYAFGVIGPALLSQSAEEMHYIISHCCKLAEQYDIPVYFQLDDMYNYNLLGSGSSVQYSDDPEMTEWTDFPEGDQKYGPTLRNWFNWGNWAYFGNVPAFGSPKFQAFIKKQLETGVLIPLKKQLDQWERKGKGYLFAGIAIGWETHIPDYTPGVAGAGFNDPKNPPTTNEGIQMADHEMRQAGYASLHWLGYNREKLTKEATEKKLSEKELVQNLLTDVQQRYSEMLAKTAFDAGIPRERIFTHIVALATLDGTPQTTNFPAIRTAINPYSIPGFTLSKVTAPYDMERLKAAIKTDDPAQEHFICAEGYAAGLTDEATADAYWQEMFSSGATIVTVFGYGPEAPGSIFAVSRDPEHGFNKSLNKWLRD